MPENATETFATTNAGPLRLQSNALPSRELMLKNGALLSTWMLNSSNVPRRRSTLVACRWCRAYSTVLQGSVTLQSGKSRPLEGSTATAMSAAATVWIHDEKQNRALKSEAATLRLRFLNDTRLAGNSLVASLAAARCRSTDARRCRAAATRTGIAAWSTLGRNARGVDALV